MSDQDEKINTVLSAMIDFIDFKEKGVLIVDSNNVIVKMNAIFKDLIALDNEIEPVEKIKRYFKKYNITKTTTAFLNVFEEQINVKYCEIPIESDYFIKIWIFEAIGTKKARITLLENIVQFSRDGIHAINQDGHITVYNEAQGRIDHYIPQDILGKNVREIYALDDETSMLLKVLKTGKPIENMRQSYYTRKGTFVDCMTSVIPLTYDGKIFGSAAIVRDYNGILNLLNQEKTSHEKDLSDSALQTTKLSVRYVFDMIITGDSVYANTIAAAKAAAKTSSNILLVGETGTGKEMFAQSIHAESDRREKPFLAINCAAIPESLLESLLFGTTKGSFTGALDKSGLFEDADGGTIFLDEINSMSLLLQAKLLRALEERTCSRLGSTKLIKINARIISSCNENPAKAVSDKIIRSDLFYRLAVVYISIPPLRNRPDDIGILTNHFINSYNERFEKKVLGVEDDVKELFLHYDWPGNIRQLRHIIESAVNVIDNETSMIAIRHLPEYIFGENVLEGKTNKSPSPINTNLNTTGQNIFQEMQKKEQDRIIEALERHNGNIAQAAKELGMSRQKLHYRLKKYGMK